jgi:hypothetical protein
VVSFIHTTWDRFVAARDLADLYSDADIFVDRIFYALEQHGVHAERVWQDDARDVVQLRVPCREGTVVASTIPLDGEHVLLPALADSDALQRCVGQILEAVVRRGGTAGRSDLSL